MGLAAEFAILSGRVLKTLFAPTVAVKWRRNV
jgi:hypothetical protein